MPVTDARGTDGERKLALGRVIFDFVPPFDQLALRWWKDWVSRVDGHKREMFRKYISARTFAPHFWTDKHNN